MEKVCQNKIRDYLFSHWRRDLKCYSHLKIFRIVITQYEPCCWVIIPKYLKQLCKQCLKMISLLSGCCCLRFYMYHSCELDQKKCLLCNDNGFEDLEHFLMTCERLLYSEGLCNKQFSRRYLPLVGFTLIA